MNLKLDHNIVFINVKKRLPAKTIPKLMLHKSGKTLKMEFQIRWGGGGNIGH